MQISNSENKVTLPLSTILFQVETDHDSVKASTSDRIASFVNNFTTRVTRVSFEDLSTKDAIVA